MTFWHPDTGTCTAPPPGATTYTYDPRGNRTTKTPPGGPTTTYTHDLANRLTSVETPGSPTITYTYNGDGLLISRTDGATTNHYAWDDTEKLPLPVVVGAESYLYGDAATPNERVTGSVPTWLHADHQGSVRALSGPSGLAAGTYAYDPNGNTTAHSDAEVATGYVGQLTDPTTGHIYLRARHYDPTNGQFLQVDPIEGGSDNDYDYAEGDPINNFDLDGRRTRKQNAQWTASMARYCGRSPIKCRAAYRLGNRAASRAAERRHRRRAVDGPSIARRSSTR